MSRSFGPDVFLDPKKGPIAFVLVSYFLAVSANFGFAFFSCFPWGKWLIGLGFPLFLLGFIGFTPYVARLWTRLTSSNPQPTILPKAQPCRGLVVLVSPGPGAGSARTAIEYHRPHGLRRVWLLHSETSRPDAEKILAQLRAVPELESRLISLTDSEVLDPETVRNAIENEVFDETSHGLTPAEIVIDITGGQKTTSIGAFLAGMPEGRRIEMVSAGTTDKRGRAMSGGDPFEIVLNYRVKPLR